MESYIEVTFLHSVMTIVLSVLLAQYTVLRPLRMRYMLVYALVISLASVAWWFSGSFFYIMLLELVFFLTFFRHAKKTWLFGYMYRLLLMLTCFVWAQGSFHNGTWFVPIHRTVLWIWLLYGSSMVLLIGKWKQWVAKLSCLYQVRIRTSQGWLSLKGYLDSGNLLSEEGVPVLFIDRSLHTYFQAERIYWIPIESIACAKTIRVYRTQAALKGCDTHEVYVCVQQLQLPFHAKVLLNMKFMTMG